MLIYLIVNVILLSYSVLFLFPKNDEKETDMFCLVYLFVTGLVLLLIAGFRGDFTSDYKGYADLFDLYNKFSFTGIFKSQFGQEIGYVLLNKIVGLFTKNSMYIMIVVSLIIIVLFFIQFKKYSTYIWLSVLMFVNVGAYYISFNIIRQIIAAAIIFSGSRFLYEKKPKNYFIIIAVAALFHKSALIMIPFYFILNFKFNVKKLFLASTALFVSMTFLELILSIIQKFFYSYFKMGTYGMVGFSFKNVVLPLLVLIFVLVNYSKLDLSSPKINVWVNAIVFYAFFSFMGLKIQMIQRIAEFFAPYILLLIPWVISRISSKELRVLTIYITILLVISYNYITFSGSGYDPYYFIWDK